MGGWCESVRWHDGGDARGDARSYGNVDVRGEVMVEVYVMI